LSAAAGSDGNSAVGGSAPAVAGPADSSGESSIAAAAGGSPAAAGGMAIRGTGENDADGAERIAIRGAALKA
jgi:hypothetical protein